MTWFPNFLNIWPAIAAAAMVIPALLVLYFLKLRRREMVVSSTLLWKKAIQDLQVNAPFQKLRRNLLLLLQMLLLILLLLALARPVTKYTQVAGKTTVVLIDRSASMSATDPELNGRTRLDEAKARAKALVSTLTRDAVAMVIAFDDSAETIQRFTPDVPSLKNAIDSIKPTDRKSKLKTAFQLAEAQTANFNPEQNRSIAPKPDVWVFSDGRVSDADLQVRGDLKYDRIGSDKTRNVAIVAMNAKRNYERPTEVQVFARLANFGPEPVNAEVELSVDGNVRTVATTALPPERWNDVQRQKAQLKDSVEFTIELTNAATIKVEQMHKMGDALAADDSASVVVPPPKALAVLLVTERNYFLEHLLNSLRLEVKDVMLPQQYENQKPTKYDVIIFDRHTPTFLPPAGNFIHFGSLPAGLKVKTEMDGAVPAVVEDVGVLDWKRDHPILRYLSLSRLYVGESLKLDVPTESEVLIEGLKCPLVVLHREGTQVHLIVSFDVLQSNWPLRKSFPAFMQNALQFLAIGSEMDVRPFFEPGATPRIPRTNLQKVDPNLKTFALDGPSGKRTVTIPGSGEIALPSLDRVGIYTTQPPLPQFEQIAVNLLDANESNLIPATAPPGGMGEFVAASAAKSRLELWWWIVACAALPLLMIEWWVYTRRVHL